MPVTTPNTVQKSAAKRQAIRRGVMPASLPYQSANGEGNAANGAGDAANWRSPHQLIGEHPHQTRRGDDGRLRNLLPHRDDEETADRDRTGQPIADGLLRD